MSKGSVAKWERICLLSTVVKRADGMLYVCLGRYIKYGLRDGTPLPQIMAMHRMARNRFWDIMSVDDNILLCGKGYRDIPAWRIKQDVLGIMINNVVGSEYDL